MGDAIRDVRIDSLIKVYFGLILLDYLFGIRLRLNNLSGNPRVEAIHIDDRVRQRQVRDLLLGALLVYDHHLGRVSSGYATAISSGGNTSATRLDFGVVFKVLVVLLQTILLLLNLGIDLLIELFGPLFLVP